MLERAEEAFDLSVLARTVQIGSLVADAEQKECEAKYAGGEDRLIVRSDRVRFAESADRLREFHPLRFGAPDSPPREGKLVAVPPDQIGDEGLADCDILLAPKRRLKQSAIGRHPA